MKHPIYFQFLFLKTFSERDFRSLIIAFKMCIYSMILNINPEVDSWSMVFYRILHIRSLKYGFLEFHYYFFLKIKIFLFSFY